MFVPDKPHLRHDIVAEARSWLGTPYQHQGRVKGTACDCIGLIIGTAINLGLWSGNYGAYSSRPRGNAVRHVMDSECETVMDTDVQSIALEDIALGDIGLFWYRDRREAQHFCVFGEHPLVAGNLTMIHSYTTAKKVTENTVDDFWAKRILKVYRFPGVV